MEMAGADAPGNNNAEDQGFIDMEVTSSCSSSSNLISFTINSPPHGSTREFEFQMCSSASNSSQPATSPADELFYKGKLLPLHLPPRLQMVENLLLQNSKPELPNRDTNGDIGVSSGSYVSPCDSRRASSELNPDEYFFKLSSELNAFIDGNERGKMSWTMKKLRQIKHSVISQKIKASRFYIKSLFNKSGCSDGSAAKAACNVETEATLKSDDGSKDSYKKLVRKNAFGKAETLDDNGFYNNQRRSFSGAIQRHCPAKCLSSVCSSSSSSASSSSLSSSFSLSSHSSFDLIFLKRSCSATSEIENSIEGAIAHCKQSQKHFSPRKCQKKGASDIGFGWHSDSKLRGGAGDTERSDLCRI